MATIGLKDLHYATRTVGTGGAITYGTPARIAKAISADVSIETASAELYADDGLDEAVSEFIKGEIKLNVNDLSADAAVALLGSTKDSSGVVISNANDSAPEVAVGFKARRSDGTYRFVWLYRVKFSEPAESYKTKGDGIEFTTPEINGKIMKEANGDWRASYVGSDSTTPGSTWFSSVYQTA